MEKTYIEGQVKKYVNVRTRKKMEQGHERSNQDGTQEQVRREFQ